MRFKYFKQMWKSVLYKGLAVVCSLMLLPIMLRYLGAERFGIWVTMFGVASWVLFFDFGLGNGLRNKLALCIDESDGNSPAIWISTAYIAALGISLLVIIGAMIGFHFVSWQKVFNTDVVAEEELKFSTIIMLGAFLLNFTLMLVVQVFHAFGQSNVAAFHQFLSNGLALLLVFVMKFFGNGELISLAWGYSFALVSASIVLNLRFFYQRNMLLPRLTNFNFIYLKSLLSLGGQFFIIQIAVLIVFSTDKIIIAQLFGPSFVAPYELVLRVFSILLLLSSLFLTPLWSAYTRAYARNDYIWLKVTLYKSHGLLALILMFALIFKVWGHEIIFFWTRTPINITQDLLDAMFYYTIIRVWCDLYAYFLNGVGALGSQVWVASMQALLNIPLALVLAQHYGAVGVVYATSLSLLLPAVVLPVTAFSFLTKQSDLNYLKNRK